MKKISLSPGTLVKFKFSHVPRSGKRTLYLIYLHGVMFYNVNESCTLRVSESTLMRADIDNRLEVL